MTGLSSSGGAAATIAAGGLRLGVVVSGVLALLPAGALSAVPLPLRCVLSLAVA